MRVIQPPNHTGNGPRHVRVITTLGPPEAPKQVPNPRHKQGLAAQTPCFGAFGDTLGGNLPYDYPVTGGIVWCTWERYHHMVALPPLEGAVPPAQG